MPAADSHSLEDLDERELVDACRAGRPGAFDLVVERHRRAVYLLCYRFVGSHEDASDLSQDVFLRAFQSGEVKRLAVVAQWTGHARQLGAVASFRQALNR